ncbi:MAG TPA: hypothetical protein VM782_16835, partial [Stellaceae bacterium]|nr:hypothetical protein [Stellaceae bacterium]
AIREAERAIDLGPEPGSPRYIIRDGLSGDDPTGIDVTTVEAEPRRGQARQSRLVHADLVELARQQEVAPTGAKRAAVSIALFADKGPVLTSGLKSISSSGSSANVRVVRLTPGVPFAITFGWNAIWPENSAWRFQSLS